MTLSSAMRTSTMNIVNGPVSAIWAPSHRSKSLFKVGLELDQRRRRHVALERLQEWMAPVGFVPSLEGAQFHQRVRGGVRRGIVAVGSRRVGLGMQRLGDRSKAVDQWLGAFTELAQSTLDPADLAEQRHELTLDGRLAVRF